MSLQGLYFPFFFFCFNALHHHDLVPPFPAFHCRGVICFFSASLEASQTFLQLEVPCLWMILCILLPFTSMCVVASVMLHAKGLNISLVHFSNYTFQQLIILLHATLHSSGGVMHMQVASSRYLYVNTYLLYRHFSDVTLHSLASSPFTK